MADSDFSDSFSESEENDEIEEMTFAFRDPFKKLEKKNLKFFLNFFFSIGKSSYGILIEKEVKKNFQRNTC